MLNTTSYLSEAFNTLHRSREKSTNLVLEKTSGNDIFNRDIIDYENAESISPFHKNTDEKILVKLDGIVWVENLSIGSLIITDQRFFYQPQYYDIPMTKHSIEIPIDKITIAGHWLIKGVSGIVIFVGDTHAKVEFVSKIPHKMIKVWKTFKQLNGKWKDLDQNRINKMQKNGILKGLALASGLVMAKGTILKGINLVSKFLGAKQ